MSAETTSKQEIARATKSLIKGVGAQFAGRKRGPDRRVRRNSYDVDDRRARVWRSINGGTKQGGLRWRDTVLRVAREYDRVGKQKGRMGPLGPHTREVLTALLDLVDFRTGRLDPTYAKLMAMTGYAKSMISSALRRLRAHGFIDWIRRTHLVEADDGIVRHQTSNAFYFDLTRLPKGAWLRFRQLLARREQAVEGAVAAPVTAPAEPIDPNAIPMPRDPALAAALKRLQAAIDRGAE